MARQAPEFQPGAGAFPPYPRRRRPGDVVPPVTQKLGGGIGDLDQPPFGHLKDADLIGGTVPILDAAQDAELVSPLPLEVEDGVDHVLQHARSGDCALLGHVTDQQDGDAPPFSNPDQLLGGGAYLAHCARRALDRVHVHRLDRVDHDHIGRVR